MSTFDIYNLITQIIYDKQPGKFTNPRSMIKYLLPIEKAYGYYTCLLYTSDAADE